MISPSRMNIGTATRMNSFDLSQTNSPMAGVKRPPMNSSSREKVRIPRIAYPRSQCPRCTRRAFSSSCCCSWRPVPWRPFSELSGLRAQRIRMQRVAPPAQLLVNVGHQTLQAIRFTLEESAKPRDCPEFVGHAIGLRIGMPSLPSRKNLRNSQKTPPLGGIFCNKLG